jgi:hypothetical protein
MNPFEISQDPKWYRLMDGAVLITIGIIIGIVATYGIFLSGMKTESIQSIPVKIKTDTIQSGKPEPNAKDDVFFVIEES